MLYYSTNILLHDSCFSENYGSSPSYHHPDNTYPAYPLRYTMESEEPGSFLPAYFPSPAPRLALSRPGTQQYGASIPNPSNMKPTYYEPTSLYGENYDSSPSHHRPDNTYPAYPLIYVLVMPYAGEKYDSLPSHHRPDNTYPAYPLRYVPAMPNPIMKPTYEYTSLYGVYTQNRGSEALKKHTEISHIASQHGPPPPPEPHILTSLGIASTPLMY
jgi:hypothetical protein